MKINKLSKRICQHMGDWVKHQDRATGKTTGLAFKALAKAYEHQGKWIYVKDHYDSLAAHRHLLNEIKMITEVLKFDHFKFAMGDISFKLDTLEEYTPKEITLDGVKYREVVL